MLQLPDGTVLLSEGETVPMRCAGCGRFYAPPKESETSACPHCGEWNDHADGGLSLIEPAEDR